jgi:hypothetical protein
MKLCPTCKNEYSDDANFCPREECAGPDGPQRLVAAAAEPPARFVPLSPLGGGPSGEVWQASDTQTGGAVAYKIVVAAALPTLTATERAQRELRQLQRASNLHIVKVVDFGKTTDGRLFVASELANGEPLDLVVARTGPMALDRVKRIAAQIGEGLLEAQKVGVVHRDLSAKNILVSADDDVRLINFPIPRPLLDHLFGVPEYMSPEQSEGKLIDQRSNTYSLGALIYLMLTGHPPHTGETPQAVIEAVQRGELTPPSIKRGGGLTPEVDRIVLKALERSSSRRPLTMRQFLTDVSGLVVTEQLAATTSPAAGAGRGETGFARTMMFAGGASEVQKLVAQAMAARQVPGNGAAGPTAVSAKTSVPGNVRAGETPSPAAPTGAPASEPRSGGTPSPAARPALDAAVAATLFAVPSSPAGPGSVPDQASSAFDTSGSAAAGTPDSAGNFRETLWFKKGDVDQMVADARAKLEAVANAQKASVAVAESGPHPEDAKPLEKPLEDRYVDDGTVTVEDHQKFSLRSSPNSTGMPARGGSIPGERMSEDEILDEIGGGKRLIIIAIVVAVIAVLGGVLWASFKGKGKGQGEGASSGTGAGTTSAPVAPENAVPPPAPPPPTAHPPEAVPASASPPETSTPSGHAVPPPESPERAEPTTKSVSSHKKSAAAKKKAKEAAKKRERR